MKKSKKRSKVGGIGALPVAEIGGGLLGAIVSRVLVPKAVEMADVAFLKENPMIVQGAKVALGVGLAAMVPNPWAQGIGVGMAIEAGSDLIGGFINDAMKNDDGVGTAMDDVPYFQQNGQPIWQLPPQYVNGFAPNGYSQEPVFVAGDKEKVTDSEVVYMM
jgi:hypothetical protein